MKLALVGALAMAAACGEGARPARQGTATSARRAADAAAPPRPEQDAAWRDAGSSSAIDAGAATQLDASASAGAAIVDWPLAWSDERAALTLAYRRQHQDEAAAGVEISPRVVVLHYTAGGSAKGTKGYFDRLEIEADRATLAAAGRVNVSSHFLIDRDGTIYRLQPETRFARHCIGLNHVAIGVENVGDEDRWPLTRAQVLANAALVRYLVSRHSITHLLGHHEVMGFREHPYFQERDPSYRNRKGDPGPRFMAAVRAELGAECPLGPEAPR